jgi:hypothetical protein
LGLNAIKSVIFCDGLPAFSIFAPPSSDFSLFSDVFGSVVQWIVFQIPILKMQVRFLPGLLKRNGCPVGHPFSFINSLNPSKTAIIVIS